MTEVNSEIGEEVKDSSPARSEARAGGLRRLGRLFSQPVSAISDQGFFALGNFAVSTILARQMSKQSFGQFSSAFAAFLLLSTVYCAFVVDPMLVYGVSKASDRQRSYVSKVISLHWRIALLLSTLLLAVGLIRSQTSGGAGSFAAFAGWAIAAPAVLRLWLARRTTYLVRKPQYAALGGGIYLVLIVALLFTLGSFLTSSVIAACLILGITSLAVGLGLHRSIPLCDAISVQGPQSDVLGAHWTFGRWAGVAGILGLLPDYIYFFVLTPERCGEYRALLNVVIPLIQVYNALGVLVMSYFARYRERPDFTRMVIRIAAAYCGTAVLLAGLAVSFGGRLFNHLYAGKYDMRFTLLLPLAIVSVLFALKTLSDALLRSLENVTTMAAIAVVGAVAAIACGVPMALKFGVWGAVYGDLLVYCIATSAIAFVWLRRFRLHRMRRISATGGGPARYPDFAVAEPPLQSFTES
jgi:O-antigen/teichoic acid export membrane protein